MEIVKWSRKGGPAMTTANEMAEALNKYATWHSYGVAWTVRIDDAPALAAIRDLYPCYDPTSNIYPATKTTGQEEK